MRDPGDDGSSLPGTLAPHARSSAEPTGPGPW